jgi:hypothetical protein
MKKPTSIFVVVQSAVYRHDVGPYAFDLETAIDLAKARQLLEKDAHHDFDVLELREGSLEDGQVRAVVKGIYTKIEASRENGWKRYEHTGRQTVEMVEVE